ncbi:Ricin B-related lectin [Akanthomyces lecanii RCEF 1005]|uniref:Ricin B-related lectin n=1 Tax=Akanthomyces lecanii RCEF 1005 TaxID=1081108 RepID=A0A168J5K7_CORDF|nr:Ricin B-related lectin [Akanthomyces lecanii RCEF 1005]
MSLNLVGGLFFIRSRLHGKVIHVPGPEAAAVCSSIDVGRAALPKQLFEVTPAAADDSGEYFFLTNVGAKMVLDVEGGEQATGRIMAWTNNATDNQMWRADAVGGGNTGVFYVASKMDGAVLDVRESDEEDGAEIISYPCYETTNQQWEFVDVTTALAEEAAWVNGQGSNGR